MNQLNLFIELTRLKKPIGFMLLFWPCAWGLTLAYDFNDNLNLYFFYIILFFLGSVLMRSAGCIVNDILDKEYDKKVLEQIAISGCLDVNKFLGSKEKTKDAINYISKRINISRPDYDRGWKGEYSIDKGFVFRRELRGLEDSIVIDNNLLESQLIKNLNSNYSELFQMFEMPSELILKNETLKVYSPSQLFNTIQNLGKKGLSMQWYKGLGEMNATQLWETTMNTETRTLIQVTVDHEESTKGVFEDLMGENVLPRKEFIENRADKVVNLDI